MEQQRALWEDLTPVIDGFPPLSSRQSADVAIIGGGITGLSTALHLSAAGADVIVLEADRVGGGTTGSATGNLYATVDHHLSTLERTWGTAVMRQIVQARLAAIDEIEDLVARLQIACDFARRGWYLYTTEPDPEQEQALRAELQATERADLRAELETKVPLGFPIHQALHLPRQAQLNPLAYTRSLADALRRRCRIFEDTRVMRIDDDKGWVHAERASVQARHIVVATHTPKGINVLHTELGPYREYGLAARLREPAYPDGAFWRLNRKRSLRSHRQGDEQYLILVGESHKTGHSRHPQEHYHALEQYLHQHYPVETITHRWSAQHYRPADQLPYIGRSPGSSRTYIATGYATDGLIWGTVAGRLLSRAIRGEQDPLLERFSPRRFTPRKSARHFLSENADVTSQYVKDRLSRADVRRIEEIPPAQGRLITLGGEKLAVYREPNGKLNVLSAMCPHMHCIVHWNEADTSWDCPCHGSRFQPNGRVIEGPALDPLSERAPRQ